MRRKTFTLSCYIATCWVSQRSLLSPSDPIGPPDIDVDDTSGPGVTSTDDTTATTASTATANNYASFGGLIVFAICECIFVRTLY